MRVVDGSCCSLFDYPKKRRDRATFSSLVYLKTPYLLDKPMTDKKQILHVISGLDRGGAENMLLKLIKEQDESRFQSTVLCLRRSGAMATDYVRQGIRVEFIGVEPSKPFSILHLIRAARKLKRNPPTMIQGWMYHGNLASIVLVVILGCTTPVFWNVRQTLGPLSTEKRSTSLLIKISAYLSWIPRRIIYNSYTAAEQHESLGYSRKKRLIIFNGFDLDQLKPKPKDTGGRIRQQLRIASDSHLVGHVARFHPKKGHLTFLKAASIVCEAVPGQVVFALAGKGVTSDNQILEEALNEYRVSQYTLLVGELSDVVPFVSSLDLFVSSADWGEGFSNSIGEAMALEVPCVVSDVGESRAMVGRFGSIVPPKDYQALAKAIISQVSMSRQEKTEIGKALRHRIATFYDIRYIASEYYQLYSEFISR